MIIKINVTKTAGSRVYGNYIHTKKLYAAIGNNVFK